MDLILKVGLKQKSFTQEQLDNDEHNKWYKEAITSELEREKDKQEILDTINKMCNAYHRKHHSLDAFESLKNLTFNFNKG